MGKKQLEEFINQKAEEKDEISDAEILQDWLESINTLYEQVKRYLNSFGDKVKIVINTKDIIEQRIGRYKAPVLEINIAGEKVSLIPVGRFILGAQGRVDMLGKYGTVKLLRVPVESTGPKFTITEREEGETTKDKQIEQNEASRELIWKRATEPPKIKFIDLNEESFSDFLMEIIHD